MLKNIFGTLLILLMTSVVAQAQPVDGEALCVGLGSYGAIIATVVGITVTVASTLANTLSKQSFIGKLVHFLAINLTVDKVK